jgi:drug/metabolite transporter (DMT)-like permease
MGAPALRGMLWMVASGALFVVLNTILKRLAHDLDPWQVGFLRYLLGALVMLPPILRADVRALWPNAQKLQFARSVFHAAGILLWFAALPLITLAELTAIGFSGPIFICLGAVMFLRERMSGERWAAVLAGFAGVLLVVTPWEGGGFAEISAGMLLMLASAPMFAGSFLVAKVLTRHDAPGVIVLWQHLWVAALLLPFALPGWGALGAAQWGAMIVCGFLGAGGHYCMTRAFRVSDISAVQSVRFLELVWAALLGLAVFGDVPGAWTVAGGLVILTSTLWLARREAKVRI